MISAKQIRAARVLLDLSQDQLAVVTGLSNTTIRNVEAGDVCPRSSSARTIVRAIEKAGIEFIEHGGVRYRPNNITSYEGLDGYDKFFEDMLETVKEKGGDIFCAFKSPDIFIKSCNLTYGNAELFRTLNEAATVKCLLPSALNPSPSLPSFNFRIISEDLITFESRFIYGDKHAIIISDGNGAYRYVVICSFDYAQDSRMTFLRLWEKAAPLTSDRMNKLLKST